MDPNIGIAAALSTAAVFAGTGAVGAGAMYRNYDQDSMVKWRKSISPLFSFGYDKFSLRLQFYIASTAALALASAALFFTLKAVLKFTF